MSERLESWKDIAAHFGRRVRTVQRWEKEEGLPVHRHAHRSRGSIFAIAGELDAWWASRTARTADLPGAQAPPLPAGDPRPRHGRRTAAVAIAIAAAVVGALALLAARRFSPAATARERVSPRVLEANYLLHRGSGPEVERAIALCEAESARAEADSSVPPSEKAAIHECLAHGALSRARMGRGPFADRLLEATRQAELALAFDPRRSNALAIATWAAFDRDWNALAAEAGYRRAIAIDPSAGLAHQGFAHLLSARGRHDEAIAEIRRAQRAEPLSAALNDDGCWFFYRARRYEEGIREAERALMLEPGRAGAMQCILGARAARGEYAAAREAAVSILRTLGDPAAETIAAAPAEEAQLRFDRRLLERLDERRGSLAMPASPYSLLYGELGERDRAIAWLERASADHDPVLLLVRVHPAFDSLRGDPRLEPLLRRAGV